MDMIQPLEPGNYILEFLNGRTRPVTLKRAVVDNRGQILYLDSDDGKQYNWSVIISIREA